jgi:ADP-ribose pyrophosphatase YjhB (NUDIX family)
MKRQMVAGLYYTAEGFHLLIQKNKPGHWQHGRHNLLGGHVEPQERPEMAMVREFKEEAGLNTTTGQWKHALVLSGPDWVVHFYVLEGASFTPGPCDEGNIEWHFGIPKTALGNLHWIIPLLKDKTIIFPIHIQDSK